MSVKIKKSVARFLSHQVAHRIKLLESALLEIHDLDNRMKMELLALNTLANPNDDEFCEEDCMTYMSAEDVSYIVRVTFVTVSRRTTRT